MCWHVEEVPCFGEPGVSEFCNRFIVSSFHFIWFRHYIVRRSGRENLNKQMKIERKINQ